MVSLMDIQDQYDRIVRGDTSDDDVKWSRRKLQLHAFDRAAEGGREDRLGALRVAAFLGPTHGLPVTATLVTDADRDVRVAAFNQAVAARDDGRALLRNVLAGDDVELALAAADLLAAAHDRPSLNIATRLVRSPHAALRAAAARIIGLVGGRSSLAGLRPEEEADPSARAAMEQAIEQVGGEAERPPAQLWWSDADEVALPSPPVDEAPAPSHTAAPPPAPAPPAASEAPAEPAAPQLPSAPVSTEVQAPPAPTETAPPESPSGGGSSLPDPLPTEARALCKLLGLVAPADRAPVIAALGEVDPTELGAVWVSWSPQGEEALGRGVALAAAALKRQAFLSKATRMATDPRPGVRSAALEALGVLGGASAMIQVHRALADDAPEVRVAAAHTLGAMALRLGRNSLAQGWLEPHRDDDVPEVAAAVSAALESLS
jgi:HEAT repeat protein